jgi:hypothetical protein
MSITENRAKARWALVPLATIVISPSVFVVNGQPVPNGDAVQKVILLGGGLCLALALGLRWSWLGAAAISIVGLAGLASILNVGGRVDVDPGIIARAAAGYLLPFLFFFVNWRTLSLQRGLGFLTKLPLLCLVLGLVLQVAGVNLPGGGPLPGIYRIDYSGVPRLQGASLPVHLAMITLIGLVSALCLLASPNIGKGSRARLWVILDFAILMGTVTRAEIAVGVALMVAFASQAVRRDRLPTVRARRAAWLIAAIAMAGLAIAVPVILKRNAGNSYEGVFNTSGRIYAWQFFKGFIAESPLTGKGLGFSSIAVKLYSPPHVQKNFTAPHNEYIHLCVDGGIFFAVGLFLIVISAFIMAARAQTGAVRALVVVFAVGTMFLSYLDNTFSTPQFTVLLVIFLGLLAAHPRVDQKLLSVSDPSLETGDQRVGDDGACQMP